MLPPLTARQREVLEFVRQFMAKAGYPPTVREIGAHFGFVPRSIFDHLKALERKGYLRRTASKSRSLQILEPDRRSTVSALRDPRLRALIANSPSSAASPPASPCCRTRTSKGPPSSRRTG